MHILFMNNCQASNIYGIERWMLSMARELVRQGHTVAVAGRRNGAWLKQAAALGLEGFPFRLVSGFEWLTIMALRSFLKRRRIQAICVKTYKELRVAAAARWRLPVALLIRRGAMGDVRDTLKQKLTITGCADGVIVPSQTLKREFSRVPWMNPEAIHVLPLGIDLEEFKHVRPRQDLSACDCRVVFVGRLSPVKGIDVLLRAWAEVSKQIKHCRLLLVGGLESVDYRRMAADLGISHMVDFAGFQDDVLPWIAASQILVLPSRQEGSGHVILEALALGLPVVANNVGGIPEYVEHSRTGILVQPGDPHALAEALLTLMRDSQRRQAMSDAGRQAAGSERFSLTGSARDLAGIFQRVLPGL